MRLGRPYESELSRLAATYRWALSLDTAPLASRLRALEPVPLLTVGSGGSQSTAHLIADLHQLRFGQLARADTPLIVRRYLRDLRSPAIVLVSASGKNPDILGVARAAVEYEPKSIIALCSSQHSPLAHIVNSFNRGFTFEFDLPAGKDGFLATNSLLALSTVALTAYGYRSDDPALQRLFSSAALRTSLGSLRSKRAFFDCKYLVVLYGPESRSPATDLESKLVEAGLVSVQLSDYRNFGHGRHHWIAKNPNTAVLALAAKEEIPLASRTLELLPPTTPKHLIKTKYSSPWSWLALQASVFAVVAEYGYARQIDPGRPGVPPFGRRVYHFNAFRQHKPNDETMAILRKRKASTAEALSAKELSHTYARTIARLLNAKFQGLILDYDGTICDSVDRFGVIPDATARALGRIPASGFLLGVATGRGKSVRQALQLAFPRRDWQNIWVGYYNGGAIAQLHDDSQPDTTGTGDRQLEAAAQALRSLTVPGLELSVRPQQITVESSVTSGISDLWYIVVRQLQDSRLEGLKVVVSTRSVDVIPVTTTKLALLQTMNEIRPNASFLCIGDRPRWPGNDAELLSHEFSLSVDEVDPAPDGAWNLAPAGVLGSAALRYYLQRLVFHSRYFQLRLRRK